MVLLFIVSARACRPADAISSPGGAGQDRAGLSCSREVGTSEGLTRHTDVQVLSNEIKIRKMVFYW